MKKKLIIFSVIVGILFCGSVVMGIAGIISAVAGGSTIVSNNCDVDDSEPSSDDSKAIAGNASVDEFVKTYEEAYIESWGVGGFLPSASIAQTMIETSYSMSVPSFGQAHNMGGVKGGGATNFPKTVAKYGSDVVGSGTAGTSVGDNTGGSYTYFKTFEAGIVGKAEFMSRQTLYKGAINNIDGKSTLNAIADGGWATDPSYRIKLNQMYDSLGSRFKWLDQKAIEKYGDKPVNTLKKDIGKIESSADNTVEAASETDEDSEKESCSGDVEGAADGTGKLSPGLLAWGYKPDLMPEELKPYLIDPKALGMEYGGSKGWHVTGRGPYLDGQCVNLTISLGNHLWGHSGSVQGNGKDQARAWGQIFGNGEQTKPKKGAIFSFQAGGGGYGHTGIVCHVFEGGTILIVEQNTTLSGWDFFKKPFTWNYRLISPKQQKAEVTTYAYPTGKSPKLAN